MAMSLWPLALGLAVGAAAGPIGSLRGSAGRGAGGGGGACRCTRPADACWPAAAAWAGLNASVGGRLLVPESPLAACLGAGPSARGEGDPAACRRAVERSAAHEYYNQDRAGAYQVVGWQGAWLATPSTYAVAAESEEDVVAAVNFARRHNLRLVVKNTGHDYLGRSTAAGGSLLVWTHRLVGTEWAADNATVAVEAGVVWGSLYLEAQARGRYVQGGWCPSVGAAGGFTQGGGFGPFSRTFGTGADNLLSARVVLASGAAVVANATSHADLFWALRGGGGGTFGVVTSMTYRTHAAPRQTGVAQGLVQCDSEAAFASLVRNFTVLFSDFLVTRHWGGIVTIGDVARSTPRSLRLYLPYIDLDVAQVKAGFSAFAAEVAGAGACRWQAPLAVEEDATMSDQSGTQISKVYPTPGGVALPDGRWYSPGNLGELNLLYTGYASQFLPLSETEDKDRLADKLVKLAEFGFDLHLNKALGRGSGLWAGQNASYHPIARESAALVLRASSGTFAMDGGLHGYNPNLPRSRENLEYVVQRSQSEWKNQFLQREESAESAQRAELRMCFENVGALSDGQVAGCWGELSHMFENATAQFDQVIAPAFRAAFPFGSYLNEADYWEPSWQTSFWGPNYPGLKEVKLAVDPQGLFFCHHCVGSEHWDLRGNCRRDA